jgi:hypothetical protein
MADYLQPLLPEPRALALRHSAVLKGALAVAFPVAEESLALVLEEKDGAYWSQEEPGMLAVLVVSEEDGHLYLVTSRWDAKQECLCDLRCAMLG